VIRTTPIAVLVVQDSRDFTAKFLPADKLSTGSDHRVNAAKLGRGLAATIGTKKARHLRKLWATVIGREGGAAQISFSLSA
jgi:hypothetical protein